MLIASLSFLAACNGDDTPSSEPSDTGVITGATDTGGVPSTTPPSSTPTATPPATTPHSEPKATRAGAIAAAKAGVMAIDHAYATFDVEPLQKLTNLAMCEGCRAIVDRFPQAKTDGWTIEGGRMTFTKPPNVNAFVPSVGARSTLAEVIVRFSLSELVTRKSDGTIYRAHDLLGSEGPHTNVAYLVTVRWNDPWKNKWIVDDIKRWGEW